MMWLIIKYFSMWVVAISNGSAKLKIKLKRWNLPDFLGSLCMYYAMFEGFTKCCGWNMAPSLLFQDYTAGAWVVRHNSCLCCILHRFCMRQPLCVLDLLHRLFLVWTVTLDGTAFLARMHLGKIKICSLLLSFSLRLISRPKMCEWCRLIFVLRRFGYHIPGSDTCGAAFLAFQGYITTSRVRSISFNRDRRSISFLRLYVDRTTNLYSYYFLPLGNNDMNTRAWLDSWWSLTMNKKEWLQDASDLWFLQ